MAAEDSLEIRLHAGANTWYQARRVGPEVVLRTADHAVAGAQSEEQLRGGGVERDDPSRCGREANDLTEVVAELERAGRSRRAAGARVAARHRNDDRDEETAGGATRVEGIQKGHRGRGRCPQR